MLIRTGTCIEMSNFVIYILLTHVGCVYGEWESTELGSAGTILYEIQRYAITAICCS